MNTKKKVALIPVAALLLPALFLRPKFGGIVAFDKIHIRTSLCCALPHIERNGGAK